jgi:hypothetical protein
MFSPLGQVVGLIEIESPSGAPEGFALLDAAADRFPDDTSLGELLDRLAGRRKARSGQGTTPYEAPIRPANRLVVSASMPILRVDADLAQLETDLADQTERLKRLIATARASALR